MPVMKVYTLPAAKTADFDDQALDITTTLANQDLLPGRFGLIKNVIFIADVTVTGTTDWKIEIHLSDVTNQVVASIASVTADGSYGFLADANYAMNTSSEGPCLLPLVVGSSSLLVDFTETSGTGSIDTCVIWACWPDN